MNDRKSNKMSWEEKRELFAFGMTIAVFYIFSTVIGVVCHNNNLIWGPVISLSFVGSLMGIYYGWRKLFSVIFTNKK